jgi:2-keto-4-pentenoate hydratase/2-oxohepta-3-ene-1,7-dioic acid hydratase in catechol pathway
MRLITFEHEGAERLGALVNVDGRSDLQIAISGDRDQEIAPTGCVDLAAAAKAAGISSVPFASMLALIEAGDEALVTARRLLESPPDNAVLDANTVRWLAPLPRPTQIRDYLCFEAHLVNAFKAAMEVAVQRAPDPEAKRRELAASGMYDVPKVWYERPLYYSASRLAVCGTGTDVVWPSYSSLMDYELEFACVIGKAGCDIPRDRAREHVFGYTIFNDLSARDEQMLVMEGKLGPGKGKDFDNGNVFGPCLVTADEISDPYALEMVARVNGEEWSRGNSRDMYHKFEDLIAYTSRSETLHPGEILCSGTVGTGCGVEQMRFLSDGDVVELEVEHIGVLTNRILTRRQDHV